MADYTTYTSKSGTEIQAVFNNRKFGELQMVKFATQRDVANIHLMGHVDSVGTAKGKRASTGACIFTVFQKDALMEAVTDDGKTGQVFLTNHEAINYNGKAAKMLQFGGRTIGTVRPESTTPLTGGSDGSIWKKESYGQMFAPTMVDQIPPFDITLVGISEVTGDLSSMTIHGVQFNSDQGGTSIDDLVLERQLTFIARRITPWRNPRDMEKQATNVPIKPQTPNA